MRRLIAAVLNKGTGGRYLVQHVPESGSDQTIAWLLSQLVEARQDGIRIFDSIIVLSERPSVSQALENTVIRFGRTSAEIGSETGTADRVHDLIEKNTRFILGSIADFPSFWMRSAHQVGRRFAFILDEVPGSTVTEPEEAVNQALAGQHHYPTRPTSSSYPRK